MKDQFIVVLPSNTSAIHFSDNTASRFITLLPREIQLHGEWSVALTEIQFPCNFLHIRDKEEASVNMADQTPAAAHHPPAGVYENLDEFIKTLNKRQIFDNIHYLPRGLYENIEELVKALNKIQIVNGHILFEYNSNGYITIERVCAKETCTEPIHYLQISNKLKAILGFDLNSETYTFSNTEKIVANRPASLSRALPNSLFVYCDICEPYITGDTQTPLLRIVPFDSSAYKYGAIRTISFAMPNYVSLLHTTFRTIEIDIRDSLGNLAPFEYGPLNVTLHFKRTD